jgi:transcriptional regulator with XRE-family HTH domain
LSEIGRKGGKASGKVRMEKLTPEQRVAVAKTAAAARWAKPVTQADLAKQVGLQVAEWEGDRAAQMGAEEISNRLADGAKVKPGKLTFNKKLKMATVSKTGSAKRSAPVAAAAELAAAEAPATAKKSKSPAKRAKS